MKAIDIHVHPGTKEDLVDAGGKFIADTLAYFKQEVRPQTVDELAEEYRQADVLGVLLAWDARTNTKLPPTSNEHVADIVRRHPQQFVGFAGVDPHRGREAVREAERAVRELGLKGFKFHPAAQGFCPNDREVYPLYEKIAELRVPALFHVGHTGYGGGIAGGNGIRLKYCRPIFLDDVAADFPSLEVIGAHGGWPWHEELISVAMHKTNVWIDLSGWSPKYLPEAIVRYANSLLQDRVLFGSDHPFVRPAKWLGDFEKVEFKPEVRQKILLTNAKRLLKIG